MENIVTSVETYLKKYVTFAEDFYALPTALWAIASHAWPEFDAYAYLGISARTKKAGKTTLKNCLAPLVPNGQKFSASSPSSMFRVMGMDSEGQPDGDFPVMLIDECEALAAETHPCREFLNKGFERGEYITKTVGNESKKFECYCPKVIVGIGGVYDTLRDRMIVIMMKRRTPVEAAKAERIRTAVLEAEAGEIRGNISTFVADHLQEIRAAYAKATPLSFVDERAEKCWTPLFILAELLCPERIEELTRIAVDMEADKDAPQLIPHGKEWEAEERKADDEEARVLLLRDMMKVIGDDDCIPTADVIDKLKEIPTGGWRRFRGRGITAEDMGRLLDALNIHPKPVRPDKTSRKQVRGYKRADLIAAATLAGLIE